MRFQEHRRPTLSVLHQLTVSQGGGWGPAKKLPMEMSIDVLMSQPSLTPENRLLTMHRWEWLTLGILILLGIGLRFWRMDRLSIEHFDEGVYAANIYSILDNNCYPARHLYAPPLFPVLCELSIGVGGTPDAAIWVNLVFGSLMIPLVWMVMRDGFGSVAAIVATTLCATSDYHIFFSRSALTDVPLCFWLLLAVWLASRGMQSGSGLMLGGASIAAALAWWTKYNGWLAIAIPLGGWGCLIIASLLRKRGGRVDGASEGACRELLFRWIIFAGLAGLLWSPVVYDLQAVGGYAAVSANHARYLVGLSGWWEGLRMQMAYHGWLTTGVGAVVPWVVLLVLLPGDRSLRFKVSLFGAILVISTMSVGVALGVVSAMAVCVTLNQWRMNSSSDLAASRLLESMLVVWWVGLALTTPLYTPYARLSLPWLVSCWMLVGILVSHAAGWSISRLHYSFGVAILLSGLGLGVAFGRPREWSVDHVWGDRTSLRKSTLQILHETDMGRRSMAPSETPECEYAIYVVGEPALFCHLTQMSDAKVITKPASRVMEAAAPHTAGPYFPKFIVTGPHVPQSEIDEVIASQRIELIWEQQVLVSDLVTLDSASRLQLQATHLKSVRPPDRTIPIRIFRIVESSGH